MISKPWESLALDVTAGVGRCPKKPAHAQAFRAEISRGGQPRSLLAIYQVVVMIVRILDCTVS